MSEEPTPLGPANTEDAAVAQAGEPHGAAETRELTKDDGAPSPADLDAREENFTGPRKPMGPPPEGDPVPETTPQEP